MVQSESNGSIASGNRTTQRSNSRDINGNSSSSTISSATPSKIHPKISHNNNNSNTSSNQSLRAEWYQFWKYSRKVNLILSIILLYGCIFAYFLLSMTNSTDSVHSEPNTKTTKSDTKELNTNTCEYSHLRQLSNEQLHPTATSTRHIVDPPKDTNLSLVCCLTTAGPWNILVHHSWAPIGAQRFLDMVDAYYFDADQPVIDNTNTIRSTKQGYVGVPFMRCIKNFLCQFGLGSKLQHQFHTSIQDDPNWIPEGPKHRVNSIGVKRYNTGYMAYAGSGNNSRSNQLIVALDNNGPLGGGSPWEVPFGELVGDTSFTTLSKIYTGYDENGPSQALLYKMSSSDPFPILEQIQQNFPKLDYITSCTVVDRSQ
jgi:cyclophilin family peptidyl-prolyl cis-trans isomerase